jgi:hypothetical protein
LLPNRTIEDLSLCGCSPGIFQASKLSGRCGLLSNSMLVHSQSRAVESEVLPTMPLDLWTFALLPNYQASHTQVISPYPQSPRLFLKQVHLSLTMAFARLVESTSHFIPGKVKAFSQVMRLRCR